MHETGRSDGKLSFGGECRRGSGAEIASHCPVDESLNAMLPGASSKSPHCGLRQAPHLWAASAL